MLVWVVALHCEAKPVIDHYRLKKSAAHHAFDLYQNKDCLCVISGIGRNAAAAATAWIAGLNHDGDSLAWINLGTAGSACHSLGEALAVHKISDCDHSANYYPVPLIDAGLPPVHCKTLSAPGNDYDPDYIIDMEASAFFTTATRFSSAELVQCVKIISDNPNHQTGRDKSRISELIYRQLEPLTRFAEALHRLNVRVQGLQINHSDWAKFLACARFTQSQKSRLKKQLGFLLRRQSSAERLIDEAIRLGSADSIIEHLDRLCHRQSEEL